MENKELTLPELKTGFSGSILKLIAIVTMLIDHIGFHILAEIPAANRKLFLSVSVYSIFRFIGRFAFPVYCFLITEGFRHTHSRLKYGINLFVFALISEIPWNLIHTDTLRYEKQNVFFTLFAGYLCICLYEHFREKPSVQLASLIGMIILAMFLKADYGVYGMGLVLFLYVIGENKAARTILGSCFFQAGAWKVLPAFLAINLYNGQRGFIRGKAAKYACYLFYPVHLFLLYLLHKQMFGK